MIESVWTYVNDKLFVYQLLAGIATYSTLSLFKFYLTRYKRFQIFKEYGIPGPEPSIYDGNFRLYSKYPLTTRADDENREKYGDTYSFFIGDEPNIVTTDLSILKGVFFEQTPSFKERTNVFIEAPLSTGLLFARHHRWKMMRRVLTPSFNRYTNRGDSGTQFIEKTVALTIGYIDSKIGTKASAILDIQNLFKSSALHFISAVAVKLPDVEVREDDEYVKGFDSFLSAASDGVVVWAIRFPFIKSILSFIANNFEYDKTMKLTRKFLFKAIDSAKTQPPVDEHNAHVIDMIIKLHLESKVSLHEVIGNVDTILIAGYDTTSTTLTYVFWVLSKNHDIQKRLREDVIAHGINSKYLDQVIKETMRLYPTVVTFTTRLATSTVKINNVVIPQGAKVVHNTWLLHRDPKLWPDPLKFNPERFREGVNIDSCAYAPFGLGDRKCLGMRLAQLEMKTIITDMILRYSLRLISPDNLELVSHGVVLTAPKEKVMIEFEKLEYS